MSLSRRSILGNVGKFVLVSLGTPLALLATDGCNQAQIASTLQSLEHSGRVSFVCLDAPGTTTTPGRPLSDCTSARYDTPTDYGVVDGVTTQPHLYALVTQTTRGEVAVIDMSTAKNSDAVLDQNARVPGANFLPVGAQPVDIVSTNDGNATFIAVAEIGRQGIFAMPSKDIRTCTTCKPKNLSDWPACALPGAPGTMIIADDLPKDKQIRTSCTGDYEPIRENEKDVDGNDIVNVVDAQRGRPKIMVTIPEMGAIAVIDAQSLFDPWRDANGDPATSDKGETYRFPAGSWKPCDIERWVELRADVPVVTPPATGPGGPACADRPVIPPAAQVEFEPYPIALARDGDKLYVADSKAPVVHVIEMKTPCEPVEIEPLLPSSREDPGRIVTTNAVAASGTFAGSLSKFVYAVDDYDGSMMVFDVSPTATSRRPISRPHEEWTPFHTPDRIEVGSPIKDIALIEHDSPQTIPATGIAPEGIRCDPDPSLTVCTADASSCAPETLYRTTSNYDRGAAPTLMRGNYAYVILSSGQIAVVDIDDYDKNCRIPRRPGHLNGCPAELIGHEKDYVSSDEASCNVVVPHTLRSANYMRSSDKTGSNQPGVQNFPTLYTDLGVIQSTFDPNAIIMRATLPAPDVKDNPMVTDVPFNLAVGSALVPIDATTGLVKVNGEVEHTLASNLEDPHVQRLGQSFLVTYEGAIPGFAGKSAHLEVAANPATMTDASSRFCDQGVLGQKAFTEMLMFEDSSLSKEAAEQRAFELADYVQIMASTPSEDDSYWETIAKGVCSFDQCKATFGPNDIPKTARDLKIIEAYQDHLELAPPSGLAPAATDPSKTVPVASIVDCCFPSLVPFNVRLGHQWAVIGTSSGFIHHVIATPKEGSTTERDVGACRNSCDPRDARKNGRARSAPANPSAEEIVRDGDAKAFINPFFRFAIYEAADGNAFDGHPTDPNDNSPKRDTFFQFNTQGGFQPLFVNLASTTTEIQPQSIGFVPATGEVIVVDGALQGIILLNAGRLDITRRYY